MLASYRIASRALVAVLLLYSTLVLTHDGEFWPFSIYPMFSRGGHPWVRSVVRDVSADPLAVRWTPTRLEALPGETFPLGEAGINQNDIANFISKSSTWTERRVEAMRKVFGEALATRSLLIMRADGQITAHDSVAVSLVPFILLMPDTTLFNPNLSFAKPDAP